MTDEQPLFRAEGLAFAYNAEPVLRGVSLAVPRGAFVLMQGPSGGGKSTLLRLLARFEPCGPGMLAFDGLGYEEIPARDFRLRVGYLHQKPAVESGSVRENLALAFAYRDGGVLPDDAALAEHLRRLNLPESILDQSAAELSVGQQQRMALLRLLLFDSEALLLDEPLSSLDEEAARRVADWLHDLNAQGKTIIMSAHGNNVPGKADMRVLRVENNTAAWA